MKRVKCPTCYNEREVEDDDVLSLCSCCQCKMDEVLKLKKDGKEKKDN